MTIRTYAEIVPPIEPALEVVLHMTMEQAGVLRALTSGAIVDGSGYPGPVYPIYEALDALELPKYTCARQQTTFHITKEK